MNQKLFPLQEFIEITSEQILVVQGQQSDIAYQNFVYSMANRNKHVYYPNLLSIDYPKTINEINSLDWTYQQNGISIINVKTNENIFCSRLKDDKWFVQTPVLENNIYSGFQWISYPDTKSLLDTLRIFFDEGSWYATLEWTKMRWETDLDVI